MKKLFSLCLICLLAMSAMAQNAVWVDLGLPSGTLWKYQNEPGFYTYDESVELFGSQLPERRHLVELKNYCAWTWSGDGYKVTGPNGQSIFLPAAGDRDCDGKVSLVGTYGYYWSSTPDDSDGAWSLYFNSRGVGMENGYRCLGHSVRLVQN